MRHVIHLVAVTLEFLLGVFCILTAIILYPGEEGRIQSKFEDLWIRVHDYQKLALSKHALFMTQVAKLETHIFDRLFGNKLISGHALVVSFVLSYMNWILSGAVLTAFHYRHSDALHRAMDLSEIVAAGEHLVPLMAVGFALISVVETNSCCCAGSSVGFSCSRSAKYLRTLHFT
jgi:hypothetical protein